MALLFILVIDLYLCASLLGSTYSTLPLFFWIGAPLFQLFFLSLIWLYFLFFKSSAETKLRFEKPIQQFAFLSMGIISFLFSLTLARDVLALFLLPFGKASLLYGQDPSLLILSLSLFLFLIGLFNARFRIVSPHIEVLIKNLPAGLNQLKIVQLSDVHLGTGPKTKQVAAMVDRALSLYPDLIVLTGDIIDGMVNEIEPELNELARLKAKYGVYFVLGNHECYWKWQDAIQAMKKIGIIPLQNEGMELMVSTQKIFIAGLNDPAITHFGGEGPKIPTPPADSKFNLLLVHQPQFAKEIAKFPYHLQLSGHTHGGQFFPWTWIVRRMYAISGGLGRVNDLWVYVSHGTGYWGPPIRLGTDGEVTEVVLKQQF